MTIPGWTTKLSPPTAGLSPYLAQISTSIMSGLPQCDPVPAQQRQRFVGQGAQVRVPYEDSAAGEAVQAGHTAHQRGFARPGRAHDGSELVGAERHRHAVKAPHGGLAPSIHFHRVNRLGCSQRRSDDRVRDNWRHGAVLKLRRRRTRLEDQHAVRPAEPAARYVRKTALPGSGATLPEPPGLSRSTAGTG